MDEIFAKRTETTSFHSHVVPVAYAKTAAGSPLRKACIDIMAWSAKLEDWSPATAGWTVECLSDLVLELHRARLSKDVTYPDFPERDKCHFHVHGMDEHC